MPHIPGNPTKGHTRPISRANTPLRSAATDTRLSDIKVAEARKKNEWKSRGRDLDTVGQDSFFDNPWGAIGSTLSGIGPAVESGLAGAADWVRNRDGTAPEGSRAHSVGNAIRSGLGAGLEGWSYVPGLIGDAINWGFEDQRNMQSSGAGVGLPGTANHPDNFPMVAAPNASGGNDFSPEMAAFLAQVESPEWQNFAAQAVADAGSGAGSGAGAGSAPTPNNAPAFGAGDGFGRAEYQDALTEVFGPGLANDAPVGSPSMWGANPQMPDPADQPAWDAMVEGVVREFGPTANIYNPDYTALGYDTHSGMPDTTGGDAGGPVAEVVVPEIVVPEIVTAEVLLEDMFTQMAVDAEGAYDAAKTFYSDREAVLTQNIIDLEELRRNGITEAAALQRQALLDLKTSREQRLRLDEIAASGRLAELEGQRRTQETSISGAISARGAANMTDLDSRVARAEAALAERGITGANPELAAAEAMGASLLGSQASSQSNLSDRLRMANEQASVDRGMALSGMYDEAGVSLADQLWQQNTMNDASESQALQALSDYVMNSEHGLEDQYANLNFANESDYRNKVGTFDLETGARGNEMGGQFGRAHYAQLLEDARRDEQRTYDQGLRDAGWAREDGLRDAGWAHDEGLRDAGWAREDQQGQSAYNAQAANYGMVDDFMGLNPGAAMGLGKSGLLNSVYATLFGDNEDANKGFAVQMPDGSTQYVDPMEFLRYQQGVNQYANDQPDWLPVPFEGQNINVPISSPSDLKALMEYISQFG
mgnify:CR=1 FL=1